jgi:hypothetical protein
MEFSYNNYTESDAVKKLREQLAQYDTYKESQAVTDLYNAYKQQEANKVADWTGGTYGQSLKDQMDKINNREKFTYDLNGDALYQQYKDQYMAQGRLASADVMGQASAMTGGYGNSYAATVGNQAYQGYLQKLNDVVPELYNMAYNRYQQEGQDMKDMYSMYKDAYNTEYGEHRDKVADYNTETAKLYDIYNNERNFDYSKFSTDRDFYNNAYNNERTYDYGLYSDAYNRAFGQYQQGVAEDQWQKTYDLQKAAASSSGGNISKQGGSAESDFIRFTYSGTNEKDGTTTFYRDGKEYTFKTGVNPYTGTKNSDIDNGTFSNGYQPDNIGGKELESQSAYEAYVNGVKQKVWSYDDGATLWVWDGTRNEYVDVTSKREELKR